MSRDNRALSQSNTRALIYCRVSGSKQVREGDGLASQERRCRDYAAHQNYEVMDVFADDITGKLTQRPAMTAMLTYLRKHKSKLGHVVIIDDISRFARDLRAHLELRSMLENAGGKLESPSIEFGEDSDSLLIENLLASVAQHHREKNGEQTLNRMRARMMNGYWCFQAPVGYKYARVGHHGKLLVRNEPIASIVQEALEGYASGRFESKAEVKRFFESEMEFPRPKHGRVPHQRVADIFDQPVYAGHISHPNWDIHLVEGNHEPLISLETWQKIQERRNGVNKAPTRPDIRSDFPLRGFVACADCEQPYTSCWSTGEYKKYAYYLCDTKGCESYRKSIPRAKIEGAFEELLQEMQPSETLIKLTCAMFKAAWDQRSAQASHLKQRLNRELAKVETQMDGFLDRIVGTTSMSVVAAYEKRIENLETEKLLIAEKLKNPVTPRYSFDDLIELACKFLASPWDIWSLGNFKLRRIVLKLAFTERMVYARKTGYRTPKLSLPFNILGNDSMPKNGMVRSRRLELPRVLPHSDLNAARLPIPPRPQAQRKQASKCLSGPSIKPLSALQELIMQPLLQKPLPLQFPAAAAVHGHEHISLQ